MEYSEQTIEVCGEYLLRDPHVKKCFAKLDVSSSKGFMYEYEQGDHRILMDLRVEEVLPLVTLFAHADVLIKKEKTAVIAKYCQVNSSPWEPGILAVSPTHHHVFYRITTPITEAPLSEESLSWMNRCACEKIADCWEELLSLATDDWMPNSIAKEEDHPMKRTFPTPNLQEAKKRLQEELRDAHHNVLSQNIIDGDPSLFFSQIMTEDGIFHEEIRVDQSGCLIVAVRPELKVREDTLRRLATYCNEVCSNRKLAGLHAYCQDGYLWFSASISLWDGAVGKESVELVEMIGIKEILDCLKKIQTWTWVQLETEEESPEDEESVDDKEDPLKGHHISPLEMLDILRGARAGSQRPTIANIPTSEGNDPFAEIFGEFRHHDEHPASGEIDFGEAGELSCFEAPFAGEDGLLPGFFPNSPRDGNAVEESSTEGFEEDECLMIPDDPENVGA